jgi:hypothetical protein
MGAILYTFTVSGVEDLAAAMRAVAAEAGDESIVDDVVSQFTPENVEAVMKDCLDEATQEALSSAAYKSRTGALDASTYADDASSSQARTSGGQFSSGTDVSVTWGARAEYASYVEKRGFSRTVEVGDAAVDKIDAALAALGGT